MVTLKQIALILTTIVAILTIISLSLGIVISTKDSTIEQRDAQILAKDTTIEQLNAQINYLEQELKKKCTNDTVKIIAPKDGDKVQGYSVVRGTIKGELPEKQYIWVVSAIDLVPGSWWPQAGPVKPQYGLWNGDVWLGSNDNVGRVFTIAVISMNENDNKIFVTYREEGNKTGNYPAIKLPESATIMDSIKVTRIKDMNS